LAILTGGLVCLSVLVLAVSGSAGANLQRLADEPRRLTIVLPTAEAEQVEPAVSRIVQEIRGMPGMLAVRDVTAAELQTLLPPGALNAGNAGPVALPRMIEVDFAPSAMPDTAELAMRLESLAPGVTVAGPPSDLAARSTNLRRAQRLGWLGGGMFLVGLVIGVAMVVRWALSAQIDGVRLLRSLGASDTDVSRQFEEHSARAALGGAGVGYLIALAILALLALATRLWPGSGQLELRLAPADWLSLAAVPIGGGLLAGLVAKLTVRIALLRLR
jgi:cell division transport system permease protein